MKNILISLSLIIFASTVFASADSEKIKTAVEHLSGCANFMNYDDTYVFTGFGSYRDGLQSPRLPKPALVRFISIGNLVQQQLNTLDTTKDLIRVGNTAYVLTYSGIEEWDLQKLERTGFFSTHPKSETFEYEEHPQAFALYKNKLIIAHGRLGVSFVDLATRRVTRYYSLIPSLNPLESMAKGVSISGKYAYLALDNFTIVDEKEKPAFRGIVVIDMETENVVAELDGMDPGADSIVTDGDSAIVSFYGQPLWKYSLKSLRGRQLPQPDRRVWRFPIDGHPVGKPSLDDKYYYTCYSTPPKANQGSNFVKIPMALDRRSLTIE